MAAAEGLKPALKRLVEAGYQVSPEAMAILQDIERPEEAVEEILSDLESLPERPFVVGPDVVEKVLIKTGLYASTKEVSVTPKATHRPAAADVSRDLEVVVDPTSHVGTKGEVGDFADYFCDRFKRLRRILLNERPDARGFISLQALKSRKGGESVKIIGIVAEKRDRKSGGLEVIIEDLDSSAKVVFSQKQVEARKRASRIAYDEVICVVGRWDGEVVFGENLFWPDLPMKHPVHKTEEDIITLLISDLHVGSRLFMRRGFNQFLLWLQGRMGDERQRELAGKVRYILIAGDVVDGIGIYPKQEHELAIRDIYKQYDAAAQYLKAIPDYIDIVIIPGNHDATRSALPSPAIMKQYAQPLYDMPNVHMVGDPAYIQLHGVEFLLTHGTSLEDFAVSVPGMSFKEPAKAQVELLIRRHIAPIYGGSTPIAPEARDFLVIERVPDVFQAGHIHIWGVEKYRGVYAVNSGAWQEKTKLQEMVGIDPKVGKVTLYQMKDNSISVLDFMGKEGLTEASPL